ncbi:unnamed protein product, partial [Protopolystoma xenopodis]
MNSFRTEHSKYLHSRAEAIALAHRPYISDSDNLSLSSAWWRQSPTVYLGLANGDVVQHDASGHETRLLFRHTAIRDSTTTESEAKVPEFGNDGPLAPMLSARNRKTFFDSKIIKDNCYSSDCHTTVMQHNNSRSASYLRRPIQRYSSPTSAAGFVDVEGISSLAVIRSSEES